jgi:hypothetical protein
MQDQQNAPYEETWQRLAPGRFCILMQDQQNAPYEEIERDYAIHMHIVVLVILAFIFYWCFIRGNAYPILMFWFCVVGGRILIIKQFPTTTQTIMTFMGHSVSYASFLAALVAILAAGYFLRDD